jgi:putative pyoverdin transport system ATP-binding/permease protein
MKNLVKLIGFLFRSTDGLGGSRSAAVVVLVTSVLTGAVSTGLLAFINSALSAEGGRTAPLIAGFVALCVALPIARFASTYLLSRLSQGISYGLRMRLCARILGTPLRRLEEVGSPRLLASLTSDIDRITASLAQVPTLLLHSTVVVGCLAFMAWLSWKLFLVVALGTAIGVVSYQIPMMRALEHVRLRREAWDRVLHSFRGITEGTKELKVHRPRREALIADHLEPAAGEMRRRSVTTAAIYGVANSWGQVLFFILIGMILFVLPPSLVGGGDRSTGYVLAILYMLTPLDVILNSIPNLAHAMVAVGKVEELGLSLSDRDADTGSRSVLEDDASWSTLEMRGVTHTYYREDADDTFRLGPIDLSIERGEQIFLVGGNGSGKTTLAKLLIGLYHPEAGEIRLDGEAVTAENRDAYRQRFTVVFSDFFLFESLLGMASEGLDESSLRYLEKLHLSHKVEVRDGELSTIDLSQGQRKRLALLTAYLEDRDVYLFDEWAADQDPFFKEVFYLQLVPELKRRGKTVILISHDDRYYGVADRIVKLDYGRVAFDGTPEELIGSAPHPDELAAEPAG